MIGIHYVEYNYSEENGVNKRKNILRFTPIYTSSIIKNQMWKLKLMFDRKTSSFYSLLFNSKSIKNRSKIVLGGLPGRSPSPPGGLKEARRQFLSILDQILENSLTLRVAAVDPNLPSTCKGYPCSCWLVLSYAPRKRRRSRLRRSAIFGRSVGAGLFWLRARPLPNPYWG